MTGKAETALIHASCIAIQGRGVLIRGPSGSGKSDLALRLIDRGALLVSDDYVSLTAVNERLIANAPERIRGKIEIRGVGIIDLPVMADVPICLVADLAREIDRLPDPANKVPIAGHDVPFVAIRALEASAPVKLEWALQQFGLKQT